MLLSYNACSRDSVSEVRHMLHAFMSSSAVWKFGQSVKGDSKPSRVNKLRSLCVCVLPALHIVVFPLPFHTHSKQWKAS